MVAAGPAAPAAAPAAAEAAAVAEVEAGEPAAAEAEEPVAAEPVELAAEEAEEPAAAAGPAALVLDQEVGEEAGHQHLQLHPLLRERPPQPRHLQPLPQGLPHHGDAWAA